MDLRGALARLPLPDAVRDRLPEQKRRVAVVRLHGVIAATGGGLARRGVLSLESVDQALERAFELPRVAAVVLLINSPGGSPTQSALIGERIRALAAEHEDVAVIAVCEDVAASGGYWLACAADEIVAHATSMVGSIGVVSGGFGLQGAIDRLGVERRLHTAGTNKARLDPFRPERDEDVAWLRGQLDALHELFVGWVRERRGDRIREDAGEDPFSGEAWTGTRAHELGLVDRLGTLRRILDERYDDAEVVRVHRAKPLAARLGIPGASGAPLSGPLADAVPALLEALEQRAAWARFGR